MPLIEPSLKVNTTSYPYSSLVSDHKQKSSIAVAVGLIFDSDGKILISQRQNHQHLATFWEFPGGKLEAQESAYCALKRELKEEVHITVRAAQPLLNVSHTYSHGLVYLYFWRVYQFYGEARGIEGQKIRWVSTHQLCQYSFPEGNQTVIRLMQNKI